MRSKKDKNLYVGLSSNPEKRLGQHNAGLTRSTKSRVPFELLHKEAYATRAEAREREKFLKSYAGAHEKQLLVQDR